MPGTVLIWEDSLSLYCWFMCTLWLSYIQINLEPYWSLRPKSHHLLGWQNMFGMLNLYSRLWLIICNIQFCMKSICYDVCTKICYIQVGCCSPTIYYTNFNVLVYPGSSTTCFYMNCFSSTCFDGWSYTQMCSIGLHVGITIYMDVVIQSRITVRVEDPL